MAIQAGNVSERKVYIGLAKMDVVAINPTLEELRALGVNAQNDPNYLGTTDDGKAQLRLDIWLKHENPDILVPIKFFIQDKLSTSQAGLKEYMNKFGYSSYGDSIEDIKSKVPDWFDTDTLRQAYVGESRLISFIRNWICVPRNGEATIDDWNKLFQGDVSELRSYVGTTPDNSDKPYAGNTADIYWNARSLF